jgi:hypothetical protein
VTCGLLAASLLSEARLGEGTVPVAARPDPTGMALVAATLATEAPVAPPTGVPTSPPVTTTAAATTSTAAPTNTAAPSTTTTATVPSITGGPPSDVEAAVAAGWGGELPKGALSVAAPAVTPVGIRIDAFGVAADVAPFGITLDRQLELPEDAVTVAWYELGPVPGDSGSAVLAAHVDFHGRKGVFFDLGKLDPGTSIEVDMSDGTTRAFVTTAAPVRYPKYALPIDAVFRRGGARELTLVTCGGRFDPAKHSYEDNTVVVATPV